MVLLKWSTMTLVLFCLAVLIRTTSGIKCYQCRRNEKVPMYNYGDCKKMEEDPKFDVCMLVDGDGVYELNLAKRDESFNPEFKCETFGTTTRCYCFTDGCNGKSIEEWNDKVNGENGNGGIRVGVDPTIIFGMTIVSAILIKKL